MKIPHGSNQIKALFRFLRRLAFYTLLLSLFFLLIQDFLVFPGLFVYWGRWLTNPSAPPGGVRHEVTSADGTLVELYEMRHDASRASAPWVAILFHGNGHSAHGFAAFQEWFATLGITSYMVEFRGYGHTEGWPSEKKLYEDAEAAWNFVAAREDVTAERVIVFGQSIGTGIASWLASSKKPVALVLLSAYSSLAERAAEEPLLGLLAPAFFKYEFPNSRYLSSLDGTCVVLAHGKKDSIISIEHQERLFKSLPPGIKTRKVVSEKAGHNDLMFAAQDSITEALLSCLPETMWANR